MLTRIFNYKMGIWGGFGEAAIALVERMYNLMKEITTHYTKFYLHLNHLLLKVLQL